MTRLVLILSILLYIIPLNTFSQGVCTFTGEENEDWNVNSNWNCILSTGSIREVPNASISEIIIPSGETVRLSTNVVLSNQVQLSVLGNISGSLSPTGTDSKSIFMNSSSSIVIKPNGSIRNLQELKLEAEASISIESNGILDLINDLKITGNSTIVTQSSSCIQVTDVFENTESATVSGNGCIIFRGDVNNSFNYSGGSVFGCTPTFVADNEVLSEQNCNTTTRTISAKDDVVCAINNDPIEAQVIQNDLLGSEPLRPSDLENIAVVRDPNYGNYAIDPRDNFKITYTPFPTADLENRNGVDSLVYEVKTTSGESATATLYLVFHKVDLPSSFQTCSPSFEVTPLILEPSGRWIYDPQEVTIDNPTLSNSSISLLNSESVIRWETELGCDPTDIILTRDTVLVNASSDRRNVFCADESTINLNQRFGITPLPNHTFSWSVDDILIRGELLNEIPSSDALVRYEVDSGICSGLFIDTLELIEVTANFEIENEICQSTTAGEFIDLNTLRTDTNINNLTSLWTINGSETDRLTISDTGSYIINHTAIANDICTNEVSKTIRINLSWDSNFEFPSHICSDTSSITLSDIEPFGQWFLNSSSNPLLQIEPRALTPDQTYTLIRKNGVASNCGSQSERSFVIESRPSSTFNKFDAAICAYSETIDLSNRIQNRTLSDVIEWRLGTTTASSIKPSIDLNDTELTFLVQNASGTCKAEASEILQISIPAVTRTIKNLTLDETETILELTEVSYRAINKNPELFEIEQLETLVKVTANALDINGTVTVTQLDGIVCNNTVDYTLFFEETVTSDAGPDLELNNFNTSNLQAIPTVYGTGRWLNIPNNVLITEAQNPQSTVTLRSGDNATLTWTVSTPGGQLASDSMKITRQEMNTIFIPQAFSPNGDGINDSFEIVGLASSDRVSLKVINRWGQMKYESTDYLNDTKWLGNDTQGNLLPSDTYMIRYKINEEKEQSKAVVLKR